MQDMWKGIVLVEDTTQTFEVEARNQLGCKASSRKNARAKLLKMATAEVIYEIWKAISMKIFTGRNDADVNEMDVIKMMSLTMR